MNWLLWPGERAADLMGFTDRDDRLAFRLFVNVVFWNGIVVALAVLVAVMV